MEYSHSWDAKGPQSVKTVPAFYGTQRYITVFATAHHLYPQWIQHIQSMPCPPMFWISTSTLHTHLYLGLPSSPSPSGFPTRKLCIFLPWYACYMLCPSHPSGLDHPKNIWQEVQIMKLLICTFIHPCVTFFPLRLDIPSSTPSCQNLSAYVLCLMQQATFHIYINHTQNYSSCVFQSLFIWVYNNGKTK